MELLDICLDMIFKNTELLNSNHKLNNRLVCPEYSKSVKEVKTYPLIEHDCVFTVLWNIDRKHEVSASMYPAPKPFFCQLPFIPGTKTQLHTHAYIELAYIVDGEFRQKILGKEIVFSKGDFCLIDKNCLHQDYLIDSPATILFFGIGNDMFTEIMKENIATEKLVSFLQSTLIQQKDVQQYLHFKPGTDTSAAKMESCLGQLISELYINDIASSYIRKGLLFRIFRLLSTEYDFSLSSEQRKTLSWIIFEDVSEYMKQSYTTISIQDLVNEFHFQEDYFNRLIKSKTGMTYSEYLQKIRLEKACSLLLNTKQTIDEICEAVGYHNKGFFYKIFKDKYGITPSHYRKRD